MKKNLLKIFVRNVSNLLKVRIHNYGFWVSILAYIPVVLQLFDIKLVPEQSADITNTILAILGALGIINNPTTGKWYSDKVEQPPLLENPTEKVGE